MPSWMITWLPSMLGVGVGVGFALMEYWYRNHYQSKAICYANPPMEFVENIYCPICLKTFNDENKQQLMCGHAIHRPCYLILFEHTRRTCSLCGHHFEYELDLED